MNPISHPLEYSNIGKKVSDLHQILLKLKYEIRPGDLQRKYYGATTRDAVKKFQAGHNLSVSGDIDEPTANALNALIEKQQSQQPSEKYEVRGRIIASDRMPVPNVMVHAFDICIGRKTGLGKAETAKDGSYRIEYDPTVIQRIGKELADIQIRVKTGNNTGDFYLATIRNNASKSEIIDVILPADSFRPPSEWEHLTQELDPYLKGTPLRELQENEQKQDLTFLSRKTGWDARLIAWR